MLTHTTSLLFIRFYHNYPAKIGGENFEGKSFTAMTSPYKHTADERWKIEKTDIIKKRKTVRFSTLIAFPQNRTGFACGT